MSQTNQPAPTPKKKKTRRKWPWIILAAIVALVVYSVLSMGNSAGSAYQSEVAQPRDISIYYSFSGNLTPVTEKTQTAKDAVKIKELYVKEGDDVTAGQALFRGTDGTRVLAQESGTIQTLYVDTNDQLQVGSQIAHIVDYDTLEISVDVDEYDVGALSVGKQGTVYLNALDRTVTGTVSDIARDATTSGGVSYYEVKMEIDATDEIRSGMSVEVNVLNREALGCVSVSVKALRYDEYNKPYVLLKNADETMSTQFVELGVSDGLYTEITSGLNAGEAIYYSENNMGGFFMMQGNMSSARSDMTAVAGN